jgi:hypothetical protein
MAAGSGGRIVMADSTRAQPALAYSAATVASPI